MTDAPDLKKEQPVPPDILALSFEQALAELELLVKKLETGRAMLHEAIEDYARGAFLKRHCENKLREAETKIRLVSEGGAAQEVFAE